MIELNPHQTTVYWCKKQNWDMHKVSRYDTGVNSTVSEDEYEELEKFEDEWAVLTYVDDGWFLPEGRSYLTAPYAIRWYKNNGINMKDIRGNYLKNIFILDDDIRKYTKIPKFTNFFGYYFEEKDETHCFVIVDNNGIEYLRTERFMEVLDFVCYTCSYLLVGNKNIGASLEMTEEGKDYFLDFFLKHAALTNKRKYRCYGSAVFIIPGISGCYANRCLKKYRRSALFIDKWSDIEEIINADFTTIMEEKGLAPTEVRIKEDE